MKSAFEEIRLDEYSSATEAAQLGLLLTNKVEEHGHLRDATIGYAFRDDELRRRGKVTVAEAILVERILQSEKRYGRIVKWALLHHILKVETLPDFLILIDRNIWEGMDPEAKLALIDHELCFPGDVEVTGPGVKASSVRRYAGKMVRIETAAGHLLTGTPNHPILTERGWVPLEHLREGDHVVSSRSAERVAVAMSPDEYQVPAAIEKVARACSVRLGGVPEAAHDLNADAAERQIDVVAADGGLLPRVKAPIGKHRPEKDFIRRDGVELRLSRLRHLLDGLFAMMLPAPHLVSASESDGAGGLLLRSGEARLLRSAQAARFDTVLGQDAADDKSADSEGFLQRILGSSPQIALDKIVSVLHIPSFDGHVYNLETTQHWYAANGIIAHNCHCGYQTEDDGETPKLTEDGRYRWTIRGHDVEEFCGVVQRNGLWNEQLAAMARVIIENLSANAEAV